MIRLNLLIKKCWILLKYPVRGNFFKTYQLLLMFGYFKVLSFHGSHRLSASHAASLVSTFSPSFRGLSPCDNNANCEKKERR